MNTHRSPRGGRFFISILGSLMALATAPLLSEDIPTGTLNVDRNMVRTGVNSQLNWNIQYPSGVTEIIDIVPPSTIVPKKNVRMKVRVLGVAFQSGRNLLPLDAYWSKNNSAWQRFFYDTGNNVNPGRVLINQKVEKNDRIDFGARGWSGGWLPFHHTRKTDPYLIVLKNGDRAPDYAPAYNQGSVTSFLRPYIDSSGRISIGDRDLIILWEASTAKPGTTYFDMQDLVVLLTFE
ncbi:hypothetical protein [Haloferula sp.]|uniref:hypothetical protein n=1 Tax=Haloferula sp. TaxID=2497595 RepID=UPI003C716328